MIALTDHDTADGWTEGRIAAEELGIGFVPGIEISCKLNGISVHLLGYLLDPSYPELAEELRIVRDGRTDRIPSIVARLNSVGVPLTVDEVLAQATGTPSVGRPHVADALVANGTVANRSEAFDRFLADGRAGHVPHYAIEPGRAIDLVRAAGGVPIIAHPWGRSSYKVMTQDTIGRLVAGPRPGRYRDRPPGPLRPHPVRRCTRSPTTSASSPPAPATTTAPARSTTTSA